jgi:tripartite-type tricarboxylate transporter receptor subunit TctC
MLSLSILQPQVKAGRLRAIAMVSGKRAATMPDVPSMAEAGYADVNADNWFGMLAPAATPREVIAKLHSGARRCRRLRRSERAADRAGCGRCIVDAREFRGFSAQRIRALGESDRAAGIRAD